MRHTLKLGMNGVVHVYVDSKKTAMVLNMNVPMEVEGYIRDSKLPDDEVQEKLIELRTTGETSFEDNL